ncbi:MAG: sugar phosphate isomerase/epimerase family protein [Bryobacteraceae bacterium]
MSLSRRQFLAGAAALASVPAQARFGNYEFGACQPAQDFDDAVKYGLDYHEPSASEITGMSDAAFEAFRRKVLASPIRCKRLNFFTSPPAGFHDLPVMRVVGDDINLEVLGNYAEKALTRSKQLGAVIVVWGSAASRRVAGGYSRERAWEQIKAFLRMSDPIARAHGIVLAIEPIRPASSNILSTGAETLKMVHELRLPNVRMMIDYSQMRGAGEDPAIVWTARAEIVHFHFANPNGGKGSIWPKYPNEDPYYGQFFAAVKKMNYHGGFSVEAKGAIAADAAGSLAFFRKELA